MSKKAKTACPQTRKPYVPKPENRMSPKRGPQDVFMGNPIMKCAPKSQNRVSPNPKNVCPQIRKWCVPKRENGMSPNSKNVCPQIPKTYVPKSQKRVSPNPGRGSLFFGNRSSAFLFGRPFSFDLSAPRLHPCPPGPTFFRRPTYEFLANQVRTFPAPELHHPPGGTNFFELAKIGVGRVPPACFRAAQHGKRPHAVPRTVGSEFAARRTKLLVAL